MLLFQYDRRYDRYHHRHEEEAPEWFTEGPSSQSETIELRGFDKSDSDKSETEEVETEDNKEQTPQPRSRSGESVHTYC